MSVLKKSAETNCKISHATTQQDKTSAYQLRYQVFSKELQDYRWANELTKTYQDPYDTDQAILIQARYHKQTVGTVRGILRRHGVYLSDQPFALYRLAERFNYPLVQVLEHTLFITRAAVLPEFRRLGICELMVTALEDMAIKHDIKWCIADIESHKTHVKAFFLQLGYQPYQQNIAFRNEEAIAPSTWRGDFFVKAC